MVADPAWLSSDLHEFLCEQDVLKLKLFVDNYEMISQLANTGFPAGSSLIIQIRRSIPQSWLNYLSQNMAASPLV